MFQIGELSRHTDVPEKTIRYYEEIGLLPPARRSANRYRIYEEADVERLRFIRRARALDIGLDEIAEILAFRERNEPPCKYVMNLMHEQIDKVEERIRNLQQMRDELKALYEAGQKLPEDVQMRDCVCHLIQVGVNRPDNQERYSGGTG
ncbi:MAG: heavy metal-responsive transcriptional regulator [Aggregatilineales bacterium]